MHLGFTCVISNPVGILWLKVTYVLFWIRPTSFRVIIITSVVRFCKEETASTSETPTQKCYAGLNVTICLRLVLIVISSLDIVFKLNCKQITNNLPQLRAAVLTENNRLKPVLGGINTLYTFRAFSVLQIFLKCNTITAILALK